MKVNYVWVIRTVNCYVFVKVIWHNTVFSAASDKRLAAAVCVADNRVL